MTQASPSGKTRSRRGSSVVIVAALVLVGLIALTCVNVTYSDRLAQSRSAYTRGQLAQSLQLALDHLDRRPWSREAALLAARSLSQLDYAVQAEPFYQRAGQLELNDLQTRAFGLVRANLRQKAIEAYEQILAQWPENITALRRLAAVQLTEKNIPQLNALADRLIRTPGGAAMGYTLQGAVANTERNHEGVVQAFEQVLKHDPDLRLMPLPHKLFWTQLSEALIKTGRLDDVSRYLSKVLASAPDAPLMITLGQAYVLRGQFDEAERCFRQAAEWDPKAYAPHLNLGQVEMQRRQPELALKHLEEARSLAPRSDEVLFSLSSVHRLLNQPAEAARLQQMIIENNKRSRPIHDPREPWPPYAL